MGKAPDPTPPKETSAAATGTSVSTAIANSIMGNVNEVTPDGTKSTTESGTYNWTDPYTGQSYTVPKFTTTQTLSAPQQAIKDQQDAAKLNLSTLGNSQSAFLNDYMGKPFSYDTGDHENWAMGLFDKINGGREAQARDSLNAQLSNQGIKLGSKAYETAQGQQAAQQGDTRNRFLLDSYGQGFQSAQASRNQPINEITALLSGSQVSQPTWANTQTSSIPTTDNAGIISNYDNQKMKQWQESQAAAGGLFGSLAGMFSFSDKRLKKDIEKVAETKDGTNIYKYRMKAGGPMQLGVMAQEIEKTKPEAVATHESGFKMVDYSKALKLGA